MCECFIYKSIKLFYSKISCLRLCRKLVKEEDKKHICGLPKDSGNGTQYDTIKYYYDTKLMKCRNFDYSGSEGNNNNFDTYNECTIQCRGYR